MCTILFKLYKRRKDRQAIDLLWRYTFGKLCGFEELTIYRNF